MIVLFPKMAGPILDTFFMKSYFNSMQTCHFSLGLCLGCFEEYCVSWGSPETEPIGCV